MLEGLPILWVNTGGFILWTNSLWTVIHKYLRGRDTLGRFIAIFSQETIFCDFLFAFQHTMSSCIVILLRNDKRMRRNVRKRTCWRAPGAKTHIASHPRSLVRVFVVRKKIYCIIGNPKYAQWRFRSDCANELCLYYYHFIENPTFNANSVDPDQSDLGLHSLPRST